MTSEERTINYSFYKFFYKKANLNHTYDLHEPQTILFHFHAGQLESNFCSLPPLISLSAFKVQDHWEISNYVIQMAYKWPCFSFSQFRIITPIWKYLRTSKHLHITRFCKFTEYG